MSGREFDGVYGSIGTLLTSVASAYKIVNYQYSTPTPRHHLALCTLLHMLYKLTLACNNRKG